MRMQVNLRVSGGSGQYALLNLLRKYGFRGYFVDRNHDQTAQVKDGKGTGKNERIIIQKQSDNQVRYCNQGKGNAYPCQTAILVSDTFRHVRGSFYKAGS